MIRKAVFWDFYCILRRALIVSASCVAVVFGEINNAWAVSHDVTYYTGNCSLQYKDNEYGDTHSVSKSVIVSPNSSNAYNVLSPYNTDTGFDNPDPNVTDYDSMQDFFAAELGACASFYRWEDYANNLSYGGCEEESGGHCGEEISLEGDLNLYAKCNWRAHTVNYYDCDDRLLSYQDTKVEYGNPLYDLPASSVPSGYVFNGWSDSSDRSSVYNTFQKEMCSDENEINLYAVCSPICQNGGEPVSYTLDFPTPDDNDPRYDVWNPSGVTLDGVYDPYGYDYNMLMYGDNSIFDHINVDTVCSETPGSVPDSTYVGVADAPSSTPGQYCWCHVTGYELSGEELQLLSNMPWVYYIDLGNTEACIDDCSHACLKSASSEILLKQALFNTTQCTYKVSYSCGLGGGTEPADQTGILPGGSVEASEGTSCSRYGYDFNGWNCGGNITQPGDVVSISAESPANVTCTAQWQQKYTVSFLPGSAGGTTPGGSTASLTGKHVGDTITLPSNGFTVPSGYTFDGWNCDQGIGEKVAGTTFTMPAHNVQCTAQWTAINYTVSFLPGSAGGTTPGGSTASLTGKHVGDTITLPSNGFTTPTGYAFTVWNCDQGIGEKAAGTTFTMPAHNVQCTAQWTAATTYPISYKCGINNNDAHDTTNHAPGSTVNVNAQENGDYVYSPTLCNYTDNMTFTGWRCYYGDGYENEFYNGVVTFDNGIESAMCFAQWECEEGYEWRYNQNSKAEQCVPIPVNLLWNSNGGTEASGFSNSCVYDSDNITLGANPTRTGYTFRGWKVTCWTDGSDNNCPLCSHDVSLNADSWMASNFSGNLPCYSGTSVNDFATNNNDSNLCPAHLSSYKWKAVFNGGAYSVYGMARCTGAVCSCAIEHIGGNYSAGCYHVSNDNAHWVPVQLLAPGQQISSAMANPSSPNCQNYCPSTCARRIAFDPIVRADMFNQSH